jgi:predicted membrane channel-forming protein YqfA (hemolysin III family)
MLYLVALAWMYVVLMVALAEAFSPQGTVIGAVFTVLGWGVIPLSVVLYILATPSRRAARKAKELRASAGPLPSVGPRLPSGENSRSEQGVVTSSAVDPDGGGHAAGDPVAPKREEP